MTNNAVLSQYTCINCKPATIAIAGTADKRRLFVNNASNNLKCKHCDSYARWYCPTCMQSFTYAGSNRMTRDEYVRHRETCLPAAGHDSGSEEEDSDSEEDDFVIICKNKKDGSEKEIGALSAAMQGLVVTKKPKSKHQRREEVQAQRKQQLAAEITAVTSADLPLVALESALLALKKK